MHRMTQHGARGMIRPRSFRGRGDGLVRRGRLFELFGRGRCVVTVAPPGSGHNAGAAVRVRWPGSRSSGKQGIGAILGDRDRRAAGLWR